jgi:type II secretion system protein D
MESRLQAAFGYALTALVIWVSAAPAMSQGPQGPQNPPVANAPGGQGRIRMPGQGRMRPAGRPGTAAQPPQAQPAAAASPPATASTSPASPPSTLQLVPGKGGDKIAMDVYGLEIDHLLRLLMKAAKVTIIKSDQVSGPVTIIAPEEVPIDVAFQIVNQALAVRRFTMIRTNTGVYKVIPMTDAAQSGAPVRFGANPEDLPPGDDLITQVVPLRNLNANDVVSLLSQWRTDITKISATSTNSVIITDTASSLTSMLAIISHMEDELSGGYRVFYLQYYDASQMADLVNSAVLSRGVTAAGPRPAYERRVVGGAVGGAAATIQRPVGAAAMTTAAAGTEQCIPDTRMNALIVLATPVHQQQIASLVDQLDRLISLRDTYFVYPVQNLVASNLAQMVGQLVGAQVNTPAATQATRTTTGGAIRPSTGRTQTTSPYRGTTSGYGGTRVRPGAATEETPGRPERETPGDRSGSLEVEPMAGAAEPRPSVEPLAGGPLSPARDPRVTGAAAEPPLVIAQAPGVLPPGFTPGLGEMPFFAPPILVQPEQAAAGAEAYTPGVYGQATITADDNTNMILVSASPEQLDLIKQLLEKLDVMPPQVHIQAIVAEVALTRDNSLGVQFSGLQGLYNLLPFDQRDASNPRLFEGTFGTNVGAVTKDSQGNPPLGLTGVILGPEGFQAVLNALTTDSHARILSTPSIFTANNQQGKIDVSSSRPFPRGVLTSTATGGGISTSIEYQSVGITLTVTPRVTQGDMVQMDVVVTADEPGVSVPIGNKGEEYPSINKREADATVNIKDGHTVIMGGLMRDTITRSASRVPILGDLPVIGSLFSRTTSKREKSELLVFLTPRVVRSPAQAAEITEGVKAKLQEVPRSLQAPAAGQKPGATAK